MFVIIIITDCAFVVVDVLCLADILYLTDKKTINSQPVGAKPLGCQ